MLQKTEEEILLLKKSSLLVGKTLGEVALHLKPGVTTKKIDEIAEQYIRDNGGIPGFKGYSGYPATLCISVNDEVVHGIPGPRVIKDGDVVSVDCGVILNGYYGDYAYTFIVGESDEKTQKLVNVTKESLYKGIEQAVTGNTIGDIGYAIQLHVERNGFSVVRDLVGHGIGQHLHEKPEVPNYGKKRMGMPLPENMVICIEPMINLGTKNVKQDRDGWTIRTRDGKPSAHFEHMVVIRNGEAEVLSTYEFVEQNWK
ncbi:MAG: type I methionyl aminopeptidase [Marinilabiliales bacterium]|nr:MAG: type I methionyl aminopeptidase [Marinilabiliales bacterium]